LFRKLSKRNKNFKQTDHQQNPQTDTQQILLSKKIMDNEKTLRSMYSNCSDVIFRSFLIGNKEKAILIYIEGLINIEELDDNVLAPLMKGNPDKFTEIKDYVEQTISISQTINVTTINEIVEMLLNGLPIVLIDGSNIGLAFGLQKWEKRSVEEPLSEAVVRGSREGFIESIRVNTSLLRRIIKSPMLKMKSFQVGRYTKTKIIISYIEGLADQTLIEEIEARISRIEIDGVLESGYIEELIEDNSFSPFPQILSTERPDTAASSLLEGRAVILVDGTPFIMAVPTTLYSLLQSPEDYYQRFMIGTAIRWLRYLFFVTALLLPSIYVAVITYHQEMIPTTLLISMAASREAIPFPALIEALIMEITFEVLREAGLRLPKQVGSAVSIVGALVIGDAAVSAGIVSAPMVMVVAITGIASFAIPRYNAGIAIRMLRFPLIILAGSLGLLGIMLGIITITIHLCTLRSFGVPYMQPMAPMKGKEMKDVLMRAPWWMLNTRPRLTGEYNQYREAPGQKPNPNRGGESDNS
jgi:hypothetical protein